MTQLSLRTLLVALAFTVGCASCPSIDEAALARRVLDRVEAILESGDSTGGIDDGVDAPSVLPIESLPFDSLPRRGRPGERVRIVVVSDFECPFCGQVVPTLERLHEAFPDEVAFYFVNFPLPFHRRARPAASAALEAYEQGGDDAFYRMHDHLFHHQDALQTDDLVRYAEELGLDGTAMRDAVTGSEHAARIDRDIELANSLGVDGTPTIFVGSERIVGAESYSTYRDAVERALGR